MKESKIYLHYQNDYNNVIECNIGYIKELLYMGSIYAYKDKQYRLFYTILILKICIFILFIIFKNLVFYEFCQNIPNIFEILFSHHLLHLVEL